MHTITSELFIYAVNSQATSKKILPTLSEKYFSLTERHYLGERNLFNFFLKVQFVSEVMRQKSSIRSRSIARCFSQTLQRSFYSCLKMQPIAISSGTILSPGCDGRIVEHRK